MACRKTGESQQCHAMPVLRLLAHHAASGSPIYPAVSGRIEAVIGHSDRRQQHQTRDLCQRRDLRRHGRVHPPPAAGWVSMLLLEWLRKHCNHPAQKDSLSLSRVGQHVAIGMATKALQPPGSRTHCSTSTAGPNVSKQAN